MSGLLEFCGLPVTSVAFAGRRHRFGKGQRQNPGDRVGRREHGLVHSGRRTDRVRNSHRRRGFLQVHYKAPDKFSKYSNSMALFTVAAAIRNISALFTPQSHSVPGNPRNVRRDRRHVEDTEQAVSGGAATAHRRKVPPSSTMHAHIASFFSREPLVFYFPAPNKPTRQSEGETHSNYMQLYSPQLYSINCIPPPPPTVESR